jgi:acyl carrier protein
MTPSEIKSVVLEELGNIAPEVDPGDVDTAADLRDEFDIDSMDFLNWVTALSQRLKIDIPEADYPKMQTVDDATAYLAEKAKAA